MAQPDPDHPILVRPHGGRVRVSLAGETVADSRDAQVLYECGYPPVYYLPREDVRMDRLTPTDHRTHCPYKGDASYWTVRAGDETADNAAWSYEDPFDAVAAIAGYLAFYPDAVEIDDNGG